MVAVGSNEYGQIDAEDWRDIVGYKERPGTAAVLYHRPWQRGACAGAWAAAHGRLHNYI